MGEAILWAVIGGVSYRFISAIFNVGQNTVFAKKVVHHCLSLVGAIVEDLAFIRQLKHSQLTTSDLSEEQIEYIIKIDEQTLNVWKENSVKIFKNSFPGTLETIVKFDDWQGAMRELNRLHKGR